MATDIKQPVLDLANFCLVVIPISACFIYVICLIEKINLNLDPLSLSLLFISRTRHATLKYTYYIQRKVMSLFSLDTYLSLKVWVRVFTHPYIRNFYFHSKRVT